MDQTFQIFVYSFFSGVTVFLGGLASMLFERYQRGPAYTLIVHAATAFGGGLLIGAVAFVLIPSGIKELELFPLVLTFIAGAFFFYFLDLQITRMKSSFSQGIAMLTDFLPEAVALGSVFANDIATGALLAFFIGLQNFPESFNTYIELKKGGRSTRKTLSLLFALSFVGVLGALAGRFFLAGFPRVVSGLMVFSGAGITYLMFQDIAPDSRLDGSSIPALAGVLGLLLGVIGTKILG